MDEDILHDYCDRICRLKNECINSGISEDEFKEMYLESLNSLTNLESSNDFPPPQRKLKIYLILTLSTLLILYNCSSIYACLLCNLQEYIYPGLKLLRRLSIPIISLFPSLSGFYHESCLIQNPFFTVAEMDCWPCSLVTNIMLVDDPPPVTQEPTSPFVYQTKQKVATIQDINKLYLNNLDNFDKESSVVSKNYGMKASEMFNQLKKRDKETYIWKFNTMNGARLLRQLIHRPKVVPKFGQSMERFIIIDSSLGTFQIPDTECSNSFLLVLSGSRQVQLKPADECKHQCQSLNVDLKESFLLWYNWWYWRPVIQTTNGNDTLIAHVGSYC